MTVYFDEQHVSGQHTQDPQNPGQPHKAAVHAFWDDQLTPPALWARLSYLRAVDLESAVTVARIAGFLTPKGRTRRALDALLQNGEVAKVGSTATGAELFCLTHTGQQRLLQWNDDQQRAAKARRAETGRGWKQQTLFDEGLDQPIGDDR